MGECGSNSDTPADDPIRLLQVKTVSVLTLSLSLSPSSSSCKYEHNVVRRGPLFVAAPAAVPMATAAPSVASAAYAVVVPLAELALDLAE